MLPMISFIFDVAGTGLGLWQGGLISEVVFILIFIVSVIVLLKVIPQNLYVKIEGVAKEEFAKMKAELVKEVNTKWLDQIKTNTELMQAMALAMCSMKAIPDSQKELLAKYLEIKPETTEALVVELMPTVETETKKAKAVIME